MADAVWHRLEGDDANGPADGPEPAAVWRVTAADGIGLRLARWPAAAAATADRGSVLLFQGRTEYIEKYARVAGDLAAAGFDVLAIDWRGQGGSDRLLPDPTVGHVGDFLHYQRDVAAMIAAAEAAGLPRPWHLLAHSMGGAIGLRALMEGLPVASAAFSAPMWGIRIGGLPAPVGSALGVGLARGAGRLGRGSRGLPGPTTVLEVSFADNLLTTDARQYIRLMREAVAWPDLMIGAPSFDWVRTALAECRMLATRPAPAIPALISVSGGERIVQPTAIRRRAAAWPGARLLDLPDSRHEAMFEAPATGETFLAAVVDHFATQA